MPRAIEKRRPVAILEHTYKDIEEFAKQHNLFFFEVIGIAMDALKKAKLTEKEIKERAFRILINGK